MTDPIGPIKPKRQYVFVADFETLAATIAAVRALEAHEPGPFAVRLAAYDFETEQALAKVFQAGRSDLQVSVLPIAALGQMDPRIGRCLAGAATWPEKRQALAPMVAACAAILYGDGEPGRETFLPTAVFATPLRCTADPSPAWEALATRDVLVGPDVCLFAATEHARLALAWWADCAEASQMPNDGLRPMLVDHAIAWAPERLPTPSDGGPWRWTEAFRHVATVAGLPPAGWDAPRVDAALAAANGELRA